MDNKETHWLNASIYLKNAILELSAIECKCKKDDEIELDCDKCDLIVDIKNIRHDVNCVIDSLIK